MNTPVYSFILVLLFVCMSSGRAQDIKKVTRDYGFFREVYSHVKPDTSKKEGSYRLFYKHQLIEDGNYKNGKRIGQWQYYSFNNLLEYEYDFDSDSIVRIGSNNRILSSVRTPCFYKGSPLIPYLFMVDHVNYPEKAVDEDISGRIVLNLMIDKKGKIYGYYISEKLHPLIDKAVLKVASDLPDDWEFLSATRNGAPIKSEYLIPIEFEID